MGLNIVFLTVVISLFCGTCNGAGNSVLPEILQPHNFNTSTCYGDNSYFRPSCPLSGTVIAVQQLNVGSKPNDTICPTVVRLDPATFEIVYDNGTQIDLVECCFHHDNDCIFEYTSHYANDPPFKHYSFCSGRHECLRGANTIFSPTRSDTCIGDYMPDTSYMYMQYYCINETRLGDMCGSVSLNTTGAAVYLQSPGYPGNLTSTMKSCSCSVQSLICGDTINVYTVHMEMKSNGTTCHQKVSVNDSGTVLTEWDCNSDSWYDITKRTSTSNYLLVELENSLTWNGGYVWLGFEATHGNAELVVNCPAIEQVSCIPTSTAGRPGGGGEIPLLAIIGAVIGLLLLLLILLICCYCCYCKNRKKKNQVDPEETKPEDSERDIMKTSTNLNQKSVPPANTHFRPSSNTFVPSLRVSATPYIKKHSGVDNIKDDIRGDPSGPLPSINDAGKASQNGHVLFHQHGGPGSTVVARAGRLEPLSTTQTEPDSEYGEQRKKKKKRKRSKKKDSAKDGYQDEKCKSDVELQDKQFETSDGKIVLIADMSGSITTRDIVSSVLCDNAGNGEGEGDKKKKRHKKKSRKKGAEKKDMPDVTIDGESELNDNVGGDSYA